MVFPTFFNLSLSLAIRSSWSEPQSAPGLVFADSIEFLHLGYKEYRQGLCDMAYPFLEEIAINPPYFSQNLHRSGTQTLGGHKQNLVCTRIQEKGVLTPQETNPDLPGSVQESPVEAWACCRVGGTECSSTCMGPFEGGHHYLHYLHHSLAPR